MRCDFPDCPEEFHENEEFDQIALDAEPLGWQRQRIVLDTGQRFIVQLCPKHAEADANIQQTWQESSARKVVPTRDWPRFQGYLPADWPTREVSSVIVRYPERDWEPRRPTDSWKGAPSQTGGAPFSRVQINVGSRL